MQNDFKNMTQFGNGFNDLILSYNQTIVISWLFIDTITIPSWTIVAYCSAWKQFFFIDCIGLGRNGLSKNNDNKSSEISGRKADSVNGPGINSGANCYGKRHSNARKSGGARIGSTNKNSKPTSKYAVKSPSNKALLQSDPLFHLYLICVGLITLSILAIKCLIPGMPIYMHTMIGFAFILAIIVASSIYTQFKSRKVSNPMRCSWDVMLSVRIEIRFT